MSDTCATCRFWLAQPPDPDGEAWGECRRNAPQPIERFWKDLGNLVGQLTWLREEDAGVEHKCPEYSFESKSDFQIYEWPITENDAWCGQWASR